ncbi:MAG: PQQ-binding-like beta-propeller repeat protein [Planctomycetota bacterium]
MTSRTTLALGLLLAIVPGTLAGWSTFHGNPQRSGWTPAHGPTAPVEQWRLDLKGPILTSPVLGSDGTVYLGSTLIESLRTQYCIVAIASDGAIKWRHPVGFIDHDLPTQSTVAVGPGDVVYGGGMRGFYAINQDGTLRWSHPSSSIVIQSPVVAPNGTVLVGIDGNLTAFSASGAVLWQHRIMEPQLSGGPSLSNDGATVYAISAFYGGSSELHAYSVATGTQLWTYPIDQYFWPLAPPTVGPDGTVYTASTGIDAVAPNGTQKWYREPTWGINGPAAIAVDAASNLYYAASVYIWKIDRNGNTLWEKTITEDGFRLGSSFSSILVDGVGNLFLGFGTGKRWALDFEKKLWVLDNNGSIKKKVALDQATYTCSPSLADDGTLYLGTLGGTLYAWR